MSNPIRQQLLAAGLIRPGVKTLKADPQAAQARQHEVYGRKAERACSILRDADRRARREKNNERRERMWG